MAYLGEITQENSTHPLDEVLVLCWTGPRSYTGEECVEIHCHGGPLALRAVLDRVLSEGARLAEPGEFTRRRWLNGRIDLAQAEAVLDVIEAKSPAGLAGAIARLGGELSSDLRAIREDLDDARAFLEASLDFPEEGIEEEARGSLAPLLLEARRKLVGLEASYWRGRLHGEGVRAAFIGRPNVGKSSLFNRVLGRARAIVSAIPGTTRDFLEETVLVSGIPFRLVDTAGVKEKPGTDPVETAASEIAAETAASADLRIVVLDSSLSLCGDDRKMLARSTGRPGVVALNKCDLGTRIDVGEVRGLAPGMEIVKVSALTGEGMATLASALARAVDSEDVDPGGRPALVQSERHHECLSKALAAVERALAGIGTGVEATVEDAETGANEPARSPLPIPGADWEVLAIEVREASMRVGEILGEGVDETLLDRIFSRFCVGK